MMHKRTFMRTQTPIYQRELRHYVTNGVLLSLNNVTVSVAFLDVLNCESARELKTTRSSRYRHICVVCGAAFTFRTNLTRHMKKIHHQIPLDVSPTRPKDGSSPKL